MRKTHAAPASAEEYRRRYLELKQRAQQYGMNRPTASLASNPKILSSDQVASEEAIPPGWYWTSIVARGACLRIVNDQATAGVSALLWNARDTSERFNAGDSVKVQWTARLSRGRLLLSDMGRVLASITDDTCGLHDCVTGGSTRAGDARKYGAMTQTNPDGRNSHDNFVLAVAKHGMSARDVGPCISFFAPVVTDSSGRFVWQDSAVKPGDYVDLRAESDLLVALSNCPHPLSPSREWRAAPVRAIIWWPPQPDEDDFCKTATEEARRAFDNTRSQPGY